MYWICYIFFLFICFVSRIVAQASLGENDYCNIENSLYFFRHQRNHDEFNFDEFVNLQIEECSALSNNYFDVSDNLIAPVFGW